ncbi:hypothetical protein LOK49_LG03G02644 [Camellia lanceoleosa]|uniref:Uncharacterized protein n=1 Tax=Camellia lanceoleosa TaxID=1840588 RepID=A0ACC0I4F6_9ERIC|nr:hypothetical protein LOK49_LG03G02644 [Camellia lanceoleosa]
MDLLIWNYMGAGNDRFRRNLRELVQMHRPDLLILLETKVELNKMGMFFNNLGYMASSHVDPTGRNGGIWLLWNPNLINVSVNEAGSQMITATIACQDYLNWVLSAIYASPNPRLRDDLCSCWTLFLLRFLNGKKPTWLNTGQWSPPGEHDSLIFQEDSTCLIL